MLNIFKSPALRKLEETDYICNEIGTKDILVLGSIAKYGMQLGINKNIEYRFSALKLVSSILNRVFISKPEDCSIALLSAADDIDAKYNTSIDYAREYITFLNIRNLDHRLQMQNSQTNLQRQKT